MGGVSPHCGEEAFVKDSSALHQMLEPGLQLQREMGVLGMLEEAEVVCYEYGPR